MGEERELYGDYSVDDEDQLDALDTLIADPSPAPGRAGQLVAPDEGAHEDDEAEAIATDVGGMGDSPEEAAMHIER